MSRKRPLRRGDERAQSGRFQTQNRRLFRRESCTVVGKVERWAIKSRCYAVGINSSSMASSAVPKRKGPPCCEAGPQNSDLNSVMQRDVSTR